MTGDPFQKVVPGQRFSMQAATYNAFIDAVKAIRDSGQLQQPISNFNLIPNVVRVRNVSGSDRDQFDVMSINDVPITPTDNERHFREKIIFDCINPNLGDAFVILQEPIKNGKIGKAVISGLTVAPVDVIGDWHEFADVKTGTNILASSTTGPLQIIYKESGVGIKLAIIEMGVLPKTITRRFKIRSIEEDYLICFGLNDQDEDNLEVNIAKNLYLRRSPFDGQTVDGITYNYSSNTEREADNGSETETQVIVPSYKVEDIIIASGPVIGGTDVVIKGERLRWIDMNVDARAWAKKFGT